MITTVQDAHRERLELLLSMYDSEPEVFTAIARALRKSANGKIETPEDLVGHTVTALALLGLGEVVQVAEMRGGV